MSPTVKKLTSAGPAVLPGDVVLVLVDLVGGEALLEEVAAGGDPRCVGAVVARVALVLGHVALTDHVVDVGDGREVQHLGTRRGDVGRLRDVVHGRIPHDHLRVLVERLGDGDERHGGGVLDDVAHVDVRHVGITVGEHGGVELVGVDGADLDLLEPADAVLLLHRAVVRHCVLVGGALGADQLVGTAVLELGEPVGLDHEPLRALDRRCGVGVRRSLVRAAVSGRVGRLGVRRCGRLAVGVVATAGGEDRRRRVR